MARTVTDGSFVYKAKFWDYDEEKYFESFIVADDFNDALDIANVFIKESAISYDLFGLWEEVPTSVLKRAA